MKFTVSALYLLCLVMVLPASASIRTETAELLISKLYRNADEAIQLVDETGRKLELDLVHKALTQHGPAAGEVIENGGLPLLAAARRHGDSIIEAAVRVPEAAKLLSSRSEEALRLVKRYGDDGLRVEVQVPGLLSKRSTWLNRKQVQHLAELPPEQLRSLGNHLTHVADAKTGARLIEAHRIHGPALLERIPKSVLIGGGALTVLMVDTAANELTGGEGSRILNFIKETLTSVGIQLALIIGGALAALWILKWAVIHTFRSFLPKRSPTVKDLQ